MRRRPLSNPHLVLPALLAMAVPATAQVAQEAVDLTVVQRIREEGLERSQVEQLARHLTEVIGPRLTGSPGMREANEWTADKFREWGLVGIEIEPWGEFGRGWVSEDYAGRILTPFEQPLHGHPLAWTGSTNGTVRGHAVVVRAESAADLERYRGQLAGAVVLMEEMQEVEPEFEHRDRRTPLEELLAPPEPREGGGPGPFDAGRFQRMRELQNTLYEMADQEGALAFLRISSRDDGVVRGGSAGSREAGVPEGLPHVAISREQYNQIYRNVEDGVPVELELMVQNRFFEDDLRQYNTLAEIPGTDKADEYVMIGAHLDSWHMGGGATDNAAGSVVMMEAMRILKTLGVQPRRTIRIALWSGEEQGLLGSRNWVQNHRELHDRISAYLNVDNGTGRVRGIWSQSNEAAIPVFEQILWPFRDLGVVAVKHGDTGGTDHLSFDREGIPGFNFIQDPIEYGINTHHTELDTFDHLVIADLQQAAVVVAATAYALAMRDEMMPRKEGRPVSDR
ncbi:MAG TPA: M20/M25/M40 family metallo-hydrolase [Longimicrobiales bacterium]|nr:M20/M25/M40 family metallo-hydrolase [Longimicrobiales bacterium]